MAEERMRLQGHAGDVASLPTSLRTGGEALTEIGASWEKLADAMHAPAFMRMPWARKWLEHLAPGAEPWLLVAGDPPVCIWPLALQRVRGLRVIGSLGHGVSDYLGPVGPSTTPEVIGALARRLREESRRYDLIDLGSLALPDEHRTAFHRESARGSAERVYERCPVISIEGTWDEYLRTRSRKFRANLKRAERRAGGDGKAEVAIEPYTPALFGELVGVERESWKWQAGTAYLRIPARRSFLEAVLASPEIPSEIWTCRVGGALAAFSVVFTGSGVRSYYLPSFCRQYSDAGTFLLLEIVRTSFADGTREVDLLQGDESYKLVWATQERAVHQVVARGRAPLGPAALLAVRTRWRLAQSPRARALWARIDAFRHRQKTSPSGAIESTRAVVEEGSDG